MPCLCGDPCCPSCGPAQGICPKCWEADLDRCTCYDDNDAYERDRQDKIDNATKVANELNEVIVDIFGGNHND